jgi:hypothetical protein
MQFESADIVFSRGNGWGIYHTHRAMRPDHDVHWQAAACGIAEGKRVGLSAGYGTADSAAGTENAFFVEGKVHKLQGVTFQLNPADWMADWKFTSSDKRLEMTFTPQYEFLQQAAVVFSSRRVRQYLGAFSGEVTLDDGKVLRFHNLSGFAERRKTRN